MTPYQQADQIVKALLADLAGRQGLGDEWDGIDRDIQKEIRATWRRIVLQTLKPPTPPPADETSHEHG